MKSGPDLDEQLISYSIVIATISKLKLHNTCMIINPEYFDKSRIL